MAEPVKRPISAGMIAAARDGVRSFGVGMGWWGPASPPIPQAQDQTEGRQRDYPAGYNLRITPRSDEEITFDQLRNLAKNYDVLAIVIETRLDQVSKLEWTVRERPVEGEPKPKGGKPPADIQKLIDLFRYPDLLHDWATWLRMLVADVLIVDAPCVYPRKTFAGQYAAFDIIDGATIKLLIDDGGRTPLEGPAYQQVLKGVVTSEYSREELIYRPRNKRSHKLYGYSPVEQIIMTVNTGLRREMSQLQSFTAGNLPDALCGTPDTWTPAQIKQFQESFDSLTQNQNFKRTVRFIPGAVAKNFVTTTENGLKDEFDEWLARVVCFAFSIPPTPFVKMMNRATAENALQQAKEEGLEPIMLWIKSMMDFILLTYFGRGDLEFAWKDDDQVDPKVMAEVNSLYVNAGIKSRNEARAELGLEPDPDGDVLLINTASVTRLEDAVKEPPDPADLVGAGGPIGPNAPPGGGKGKPTGKPNGGGNAPPGGAKGVGKSDRPFVKSAPRSISVRRAKVTKAIATLAPDLAAALKAKIPVVAAQVGDFIAQRSKAAKPPKVLLQLDFGDWDLFAEPMMTQAEIIYRDAGKKAATSLGVDAGDAIFDVVDARAVAWAAERAAELVTEIEETTRSAIAGDVAAAIEDGWSSQKLANVLADNYAFSDSRAEVIARTELAFASTSGAMESYREVGTVTGKKWILGPEPCAVCMGNADQGEIGIDDDFESGDDAPPAHPNCVCDVIPILKEEEPQ